MGEQIARYKPGGNVPGFATGTVVAGRFVSVTGHKTTQGDYPVAHAPAGTFPFGVAEQDSGPNTQPAHSVERRINIVRRGIIGRVCAGADLEAGDEVMVGTGGKAIPVGDVPTSHATLAAGSGSSLVTVTAREEGAGGNAISLTIVNPATNNASLTVDVDNGTEIIVSLATNGSAVATSTAAQVVAAINEDNTAGGLVAATGAGAGVVAILSLTHLAGGSDETAGRIAGRCLTDTDTDDFAEVDIY